MKDFFKNLLNRRELRRSALFATYAFLALFSFRLVYGYLAYPNGVEMVNFERDVMLQLQGSGGFSETNLKSNYAGQAALKLNPTQPSFDQRYEKIADMTVSTTDFDDDEAKFRELSTHHEALIQHEQASGLAGNRVIFWAIGVAPDKFDQAMADLKVIGKLADFSVNKIDKTNEYHTLIAQRESLQESIKALEELKSISGAKVEELSNLQRQIMDLQSQAQSLGVTVGEFDSEFEFVTIKFKMYEVPAPTLRHISLVSRFMTAFQWTVKYYLALAVSLFAMAFAISILRPLTYLGVQKWKARKASKE